MSTVNPQVKIRQDSKRILNLTIPRWMSKLTLVNFNIKKLDLDSQGAMEQTASSCFIGELHQTKTTFGATYHDSDYGNCRICVDLAQLAPHVFGSTRQEYDGDNAFAPLKEISDPRKYNPTTKGIENFLEFVAFHIEVHHEQILTTKKTVDEVDN